MAVRKSQVSIQFSWIFILIAGAIILLFFIGIVYKQKDVSETRLSATLLKQLDPILSGAQLEEQALNEIDITSPAAMQFVCDGEESYYSIGNTRKPTPTKIIFAPSEIESQKLITWTQSFNKPFKVTNLFYLTSPTVRYIIIGNEDIYDMIPDEIEKYKCTSVSSCSLSSEGHDQERIVSFDGNPTALYSQLDADKITAVSISDSKVTFYASNGDEETSTTIDTSTTLGAIFSEDKESYDCNMNKLLEKYKLIASIYARKESDLSEYFDAIDHGCSFFYNKNTEALSDHLQTCTDISLCAQINTFSGKISEDNQRLLKQSCPLIY